MKFLIRIKQGARHLYWSAETGDFVTAVVDASLYDELPVAIGDARAIKLPGGTTLAREDLDVVPWGTRSRARS